MYGPCNPLKSNPKKFELFPLSSSWFYNFSLMSLPILFHVKTKQNIVLVLSTENLNPHLCVHSPTLKIASYTFLVINST